MDPDPSRGNPLSLFALKYMGRSFVYAPKIANTGTENMSQPGVNPRTPLPSCPIPKCQIKAVANGLHGEGTKRRSTSGVPSRNIVDVSSKLNLVVDREVEVSVETHAEPEPRLEETSTFFQEIGEKQFKCLCCFEIFTEGKYVKKHIDDVHRDLTFRCPACECRYNTKGGLNNHIRNIEGCRVSIIQRIAFMTSNRNFFSDASAKGSPQVLGPEENSQPAASVERESSPSSRCLTLEEDSNTIPSTEHKPLSRESLILIGEMIEETGDNKHTCSYCARIFSRREHARRHIKQIHLGLRPFPCLKCGKAFKDKYHLKTHTSSCGCQPSKSLGLGEGPQTTTFVELRSTPEAELIAGRALLSLGRITQPTATAEPSSEEHADEVNTNDEHADEGILLDWD